MPDFQFFSYCEKEDTEETTQHIFGECDYFWKIRRELTGQTLLSVPFEVTGAVIIKFLKAAKLQSMEGMLD